MKDVELLKRVDHLIEQAKKVIETKYKDGATTWRVQAVEHGGFRAATLSFVGSLYGTSHSYYQLMSNAIPNPFIDGVEKGISILLAIRHEIENGWLRKIRDVVTAEVFSDFLEMSEHLLDEGYKDAAAVMIGSTLEEHLRQLCDTYKVDKTILKGTDDVPKKADALNVDLKKTGAYNAIDQKQVTAWLGIRNSAAHGKYGEYTKDQVKTMYDGVLNFIARVK